MRGARHGRELTRTRGPVPLRAARRRFERALAIVLACVASFATGATAPAPDPLPLAASARLLAGLPAPDLGPAHPLSQSPSISEHRRAMNAAWSRFRTARLDPIRTFAASELAAFPHGGRLYYPFSGPDVVHALAMFPGAQEYVLTGLEPVGRLRDIAGLAEEQRILLLSGLRDSLHVLLGAGFFRTEDMREDYSRDGAVGVLPALLALLARMDATPLALERGCIREGGRLQPSAAGADAGAAAGCIEYARIDFRLGGDSAERRLFYVSADLSNAGMRRQPAYRQWADRPADATFLKAASYLMHKSYFSGIRELILARSRIVVQDDSGIPWQQFDPALWNAMLYGRYDRPIAMFTERRQADLKRAYDAGAKPLDFGIGYRHKAGDSNLQVFVRR